MSAPMLVPAAANSSSSKARDGWYLVGCIPPVKSLSHVKVDAPTFSIGRRPESDLQVASQCVSARHAEILQIGPHLFIRDLGSTNGTYLNRRLVTQPTPISDGDHIEIANVEFRVEFRSNDPWGSRCDIDVLKKTAQAVDILESSWILSQFNELMQKRSIVPHYQPILSLETSETVGFEALARTSLVGLENPAEMFRTAEMVNQEVELSLICRRKAAEHAHWMPQNSRLFINTHSHESLEIDVLPSLEMLRSDFPGRELVVEIHEGAIANPRATLEFCKNVRDLGCKVAYDDFGAGQSRLLELVKAPPDYLKFDACLIRDVHQSNPYQWRMLKMLVDMCHDVPIVTIAEGVELEEERDACRDLGFDFGQGYYFSRPLPPESWQNTGDDTAVSP